MTLKIENASTVPASPGDPPLPEPWRESTPKSGRQGRRLGWSLRFAGASLAVLIALIAFREPDGEMDADQADVGASASQVFGVLADDGDVFARGRLEPRDQVRSIAPAGASGGATLVELHVATGDTVQKGDVVAVLDRADYLTTQCRVAEARVREAEARRDLELLVVETNLEEREAALHSAEARLELARLKLERRLAMDARATTQEALDDARLELRSANAAVLEARSRLRRYAMPETGTQLDVLTRSRQVEVAEAELSQAREELENAFVRAPLDGVVLDVLVREGEAIGGGPIMEIADTREMFARLEVYETDATELALGGRVEITSPAFAGTLFGEIVWISGRVEQQSVIDAMPAANTDARVIEVLVELGEESSTAAKSLVSLQVRGRFLR